MDKILFKSKFENPAVPLDIKANMFSLLARHVLEKIKLNIFLRLNILLGLQKFEQTIKLEYLVE